MDEIVRRDVASVEREEERNVNVVTLLNMFLNHFVEVLVDLVKGRLQGQFCAPS